MTQEVLKLALEALELVNLEFVCGNGSHHAKKDRHEWDEDCPITDRWREAITAIKEALAQPEYRAVKTYHEGKPVYVAQPEQPKYRRGSRVICLETEEYCVIHISGTDRQWVKFPDSHIGVYTNEQVAELFELLPKEQPQQEPDDLTIAYMAGLSRGKDLAPQRTWVGLIRGVRVEGNAVVITVKGGNDAARELCSELVNEMGVRNGA